MNADSAIEQADWVTLLSNLAVSWTTCLEIIVRAIDASDQALAQVLNREHALTMADVIMMKPPAMLGDRDLWQRFRVLRQLAGKLLGEVVRRLEQARGVSEVARLMLPPQSMGSMVDLPSLERAVRIEGLAADLTSGDEQGDVRQIAIAGMLEKYQKLGEEYAARVSMQLELPSRDALGLCVARRAMELAALSSE
jgi:hypothetical protein